MSFPKNLVYNKDFSWIKISKGIATVGMIQESVDNIKEIVLIDLPKKGQKIKLNETYVTINSLKWSGDLSCPVEGEVVEVNDGLFDEPNLLNEDSYKNWIVKLTVETKESDLMSSEKAKKYYGDKIK
ncbi:MAG: glycine cleavage system protein H [Candidatus Woesearchaeota archaeon]